MSNNEVWVYIESEGGKIADVSFELLGKATDLANQLKTIPCAVIIGHNLKNQFSDIFKHGAKKIYYLDSKEFEHYRPKPFTDILCKAIKDFKPQVVLYGATTRGRDLAPRIASALKVGLTADCTDLKIGDYNIRKNGENILFKDILYQIRPAFGGNIIATIVSPESRPQMATVREGVMKTIELSEEIKGEVVKLDYQIDPDLFTSKVIKKTTHENKIDIKKAQIIVSGGMGVGSKENFELIFKLAHTLGAEVGGSRAAVDAGFIPKERQVGQTGVTVRPKLYIAIGISGQIQHIAGMNESNRIIAINNDPDAPIFKIAHYGIVGDLNEIIPKFIEAYKKLKK